MGGYKPGICQNLNENLRESYGAQADDTISEAMGYLGIAIM